MDATKLLVLDCETTEGGEAETCEPIEIAYYLIGKDEVKTFLMCPPSPCLPSASVIHGLMQKDINKFESIQTVLPKFYDELIADMTLDTYVIAYNAPFDIGCLSRAFSKYLKKRFAPKKVLDLLRLAQKTVPVKASGNHRLDTIYFYLFPDKLDYLLKCRQEHSGAMDVKLEADVLDGLWARAEALEGCTLTMEELIAYTVRPEIITVWPFGKAKDQDINNVVANDRGYISWFLKQPWCNDWPDLVYTLKEKYEIQR